MELCNKNKVFEKSGGKKEGKITKIKTCQHRQQFTPTTANTQKH